MVSTIELIKRTARGASKTGSPQLYIISFTSLFLALLFLYEIIRTIRITKSIWKNVTSRFRILVLSFSFIGLFIQTLTALISFNWESIFLIFFFYVNLVYWFIYSSYIAYIFYVVKTLQLIEGKQTKIRKYSDLIFGILIIITFALLILFCYLDAKNLNDNTKFSDAYRLQNLYNIIWILPLSIIFIVISIKSYKKFGGYILVKIQKERIKYVLILTIIGCCFFGAFLIWVIFSVSGANKMSNNLKSYLENEEYSKFDNFNLFFHFIFFFIPSFIIFFFLHHILTIEKRMFQREENILLADPDDDGIIYNKNEYKLMDIIN
ncbi:hypothetical protein M0811_00714 [Anaeramoeba ignava]|uniref:Uncharacterized protein n=1 Tax=Anaeramoeba ignava TaxID=1746090 RepID=A0A9Q0LK26_ANAIG|nr:hypothetical protein M0811_00714 [Anaeramoeba ignava]